jgi:two-component system chemotaxis response regulator CheB
MQTATPTIRLLIVDHSPASRERLRLVFDVAPNVEVVGEAGTTHKALRLLEEVSPTAVLVDSDLPAPGSFALVNEMMRLYRVPIVMVTTQGQAAVPALETKALQAGAVALAALTPGGAGIGGSGYDALIRTVRAMSEVKVVRRRGPQARTELPASKAGATPIARTPGTPASSPPASIEPAPIGRIEIVAIGASTGGPQVLEKILRGLAKHLTVPVLLVQHLSQGFQNNLVAWLADATGARIRVGEQGMPLSPGVVYLAPDNSHMVVDGAGCLALNNDPPENGSRPSVSVLFRSVAEHYGPRAIGILLTGMGRDGAKELRLMRDRGAMTIAQDEATSAVHGMPGEAIKLKGARYVLAPDRITSVVEHHLLASSHGQRETVPCQ